jgi:nucleotidyltransferase substrate binding protein (TIGR01987 family)
MERVRQRIAIAARALGTLEEVLRESPSVLVRDAAIKRFEYTFEALWKAAQALLTYECLEANSPRGSVRASLDAGLLTSEQAEAALRMVDDRNLRFHVYVEAVATAIYTRLAGHAALLRLWLNALEKRSAQTSIEPSR